MDNDYKQISACICGWGRLPRQNVIFSADKTMVNFEKATLPEKYPEALFLQ